MFEIGANYEFQLIEGGDTITFWGVVERYEHPLIKLEDQAPVDIQIVSAEDGSVAQTIKSPTTKPYPGRIINITSPNFVSAVRKD